jgi:hypothetical protein
MLPDQIGCSMTIYNLEFLSRQDSVAGTLVAFLRCFCLPKLKRFFFNSVTTFLGRSLPVLKISINQNFGHLQAVFGFAIDDDK